MRRNDKEKNEDEDVVEYRHCFQTKNAVHTFTSAAPSLEVQNRAMPASQRNFSHLTRKEVSQARILWPTLCRQSLLHYQYWFPTIHLLFYRVLRLATPRHIWLVPCIMSSLVLAAAFSHSLILLHHIFEWLQNFVYNSFSGVFN